VVGVSKMSAGNYMQERYNHVIHVARQNKGEKMQTLGVQKGGIGNYAVDLPLWFITFYQ
jgi:hypothetical protein